MKSSFAAARQTAPWAIAAAILWFLFSRVPIAEAWRAAGQARLLEFELITAFAVTAWWLLESGAFAYLFTRFNARLTWSEARALRGTHVSRHADQLEPGYSGHHPSSAALQGIGAVQSTSSMLFYQTVDLVVLATLALAGASTLPASPAIASVQRAAAIAACFAIAVLAVPMASRPRWGWLRRLRNAGIFSTIAKRPRATSLC